METVISETIDSLNDEQLEEAVADFLAEQELVGEFLVWVEKWKSTHRMD